MISLILVLPMILLAQGTSLKHVERNELNAADWNDVEADLDEPERWNEDSRIEGGSDAGDGAVPYQALVIINLGQHICGGSIVNENWILTAGHCTEGRFPKDLLIAVDTNKLNSIETTYNCTKITTHEKFDYFDSANDIAVVKVEKKIKFSSSVQPIALATKVPPVNTKLLISGWGSTSGQYMKPEGNVPINLQWANVTTISIEECKSAVKNMGNANKQISKDTQVCSKDSGVGACPGDSGGPAVIKSPSGKPEQVGVVSWGKGCGEIVHINVFTSVPGFKSWIEENTK